MRVTTPDGGADQDSPRLPAVWAVAMTMAGLAVTFALDRATGSAPVQHLYYVPILLAASSFGYAGGIVTAGTAIVLYHLANPHLLSFRYDEIDLVQVVLFVAVGMIAARLMSDGRRLRALAMTDDLTGLHNLRSFERHLARLVGESAKTRLPLAVFVLDVDRLKSLNDTHGHLVGASAVRTVGHIIAAHVPARTVACRYGGDEFVLAIPCCDAGRARAVADDLRAAVRAAAPTLADVSFPAGTLSVSIGVAYAATAPEAAMSGEALFAKADAALYIAKATGRDRVHVDDTIPQPTP